MTLLVFGASISSGSADHTIHAVADGVAPVTAAIQQAINEAAASGGGRVVVPKGVFISGPLVLTSKVDLHLADGAVLRMSDDRSLYPITKNNRAAFISARDASDIRISGKGTIDGQGESWWKTYLEEKAAGTKDAPRRPQLIAFKDCQRIEVEGVTTLNPPNTHYSFKQCKDLVIRDIKATAPDDSPNTDALNLSSVKNVLITGSTISTGDDNIVLLCGAAKTKGVPEVENVVIRDCKMGFGHGISIGSYTSGGVREVTVENVTFDGTTSGIRMKADRDRGGVVEGIQYRNISMKNVRYPVFITSYYPKPPAHPSQDKPHQGKAQMPVWRDISIDGVEAVGCQNSIILWGLPDEPIRGVSMRNVNMAAKAEALVFHANDIRFTNVNIASPLRTYRAQVTGMNTEVLADSPVKFQ